MPRSGPTIAEISLATIREHGPQDTEALTDVVVAAGRSKARDPRAVVSAALMRDAHGGHRAACHRA